MFLRDTHIRAGLERQDRIDEERCKAKEGKKRAASSSALPLVVNPSRPNKKLQATASSDSRKPPNYSEDKDFLISCAYVNVSVDPDKGVGQKSDTFWTCIQEKFLILSYHKRISRKIVFKCL